MSEFWCGVTHCAGVVGLLAAAWALSRPHNEKTGELPPVESKPDLIGFYDTNDDRTDDEDEG